MWAIAILATLLCCVHVHATKAVFAHFMVENAKTWTESQWERDIDLARDAHIDGFALNIRSDDKSAWNALNTVFKVADGKGDFKMILSFDYAGGGPWSANVVQQHILQFSAYDSYFKEDGKPLVSTFEGPENAADWKIIKQKTNCLLLPDWSSLGAKQALDASDGVIDGLFSWSAWPWGDMDMNTYVDASYLEFMNQTGEDWGKNLKFMMPASPWFYTNLPGYNKNWMWRGDSLWFDRWQEIIFLNPDYVQIISWNDFGESHHIGPLYVDGDDYQAFTVGEAPFNYAADMPHDGWRQFLPFVIDLYKNRAATITEEGLSVWYRPTPKQSGCDDGWTTGNTASQLQKEFWPYDIVEDKIFYTALLESHQSVKVTVGGVDLGAKWTKEPENGSGLYHGSVAYGSSLGDVVVQVGSMTLNGRKLTSSCDQVDGQGGQQNWNAWVGSQTGSSVNKKVDISKWVCIEGTAPGAPDFAELCEFTCGLGYCPPGACYCSNMGGQKDLPDEDTPGYGSKGYPAEGAPSSFQGLCAFACNLGTCPPEHCDTEEHPLVIPNVSPFTPDACTSGEASGDLEGLCKYACNYGFCPIHTCTCSTTGALHEPPAISETSGSAKEGLDPLVYDAICDFACSRGYCPEATCVQEGSDGHEVGNPVYIGTEVFDGNTAHCEPPCVLVLPPSVLPESTTIKPPAYTTSIEVGSTTSTITLSPSPIVVGQIPFSNVPVTTSITDGAVFVACTSLAMDPLDVTITYTTAGKTSITTRELTLPPWPQMTQGPPDSWTESCDVWGGVVGTGGNDDSDSPTSTTFTPKVSHTETTDTPVPTWTEFPPITIEDDNEDNDDDDDDDNEGIVVVGCKDFWFFSFCPEFDEFKITNWKFKFPVGKIGPGPPPPSVIQRDGWKIKIKGELPPWPVVTLPPGPNPTLSHPGRPEDCNTLSQEVHFETVSQGLSVSAGKTITTTESTITRTAFVYGCEVPEYTETISSCKIAKRTEVPVAALAEPTSGAEPTAEAEPDVDSDLEEMEKRQAATDSIFNQDNPIQWEDDLSCPGRESDYILYPYKYTEADTSLIRARLTKWKGTNNFDFIEVRSEAFSITVYFVVIQMPLSMRAKLAAMSQVRYLYDYRTFLKTKGLTWQPFGTIGRRDESPANLGKRAQKTWPWSLSQLGTPPGVDWLNDKKYVDTDNEGTKYNYFHDSSEGAGQTIYVLEDNFPASMAHPEFNNIKAPTFIRVPDYGPISNPDMWHGAAVIAAAAGGWIGVSPQATVVPVDLGGVFGGDQAMERIIHALLTVADHIKASGNEGKAVINMSWGLALSNVNSIKPFAEILANVLFSLQDTLGVVLVAAAGNYGLDPNSRSEKFYPQRFAHNGQLPNMLVVGAVDKNARRWDASSYFTSNEPGLVYAWGKDVLLPTDDGGYATSSGTSFSSPMIAGLVAYFRGLPSEKWSSALRDPSNVAQLVRNLVRPLTINDPDTQSTDGAPDSLVWNGQIEGESCLVKNIQGCPSWLSPGGGSGSGGSAGGSQYTFEQGSPSPTCTAGCGVLCTGYYCDAEPTGSPPDFGDPVNSKGTATATQANPNPTTTNGSPRPTGDNAIEILVTWKEEDHHLWYFLKSVVNGVEQEECNTTLTKAIAGLDDIDLNNPGLPPYNVDLSDEEVFGYTNCAYTTSSTGGKIECDGGVSAQCKAPATQKKFYCDKGPYYAGRTMNLSVTCVFST